MEKYGLLDTAYREWRFKTTALKSWELCVKHFIKTIKDLDNHTTSEIQGYHGANAANMEAMLDAAS